MPRIRIDSGPRLHISIHIRHGNINAISFGISKLVQITRIFVVNGDKKESADPLTPQAEASASSPPPREARRQETAQGAHARPKPPSQGLQECYCNASKILRNYNHI